MIKTIAIITIVLLITYYLYVNGYVFVSSKRAVLFIGSKGGKKARFVSCTGYIKRAVKFKENRLCQFTFYLVFHFQSATGSYILSCEY